MIQINLKTLVFVDRATLSREAMLRRIISIYKLLIVSTTEFNKGLKDVFLEKGYTLREGVDLSAEHQGADMLKQFSYERKFLISRRKTLSNVEEGILVVVDDPQKTLMEVGSGKGIMIALFC